MTLPEYERGYADAMRNAVTWLATRADSMNDNHAKLVLHSAATNLGWHEQRMKVQRRASKMSGK